MSNKPDCQYQHDWVDGKCNTCGMVDSIKRIAALERKVIEWAGIAGTHAGSIELLEARNRELVAALEKVL